MTKQLVYWKLMSTLRALRQMRGLLDNSASPAVRVGEQAAHFLLALVLLVLQQSLRCVLDARTSGKNASRKSKKDDRHVFKRE